MASWGAAEVEPDPRPEPRDKASRDEWAEIHERFEFATCVLCGIRPVELHHIVPRSQGGDDTFVNLAPLCHPHHMALESHGPGWERIATAVRAYVLHNHHRCVYVIGKLGWDRFNARYPLPAGEQRGLSRIVPEATEEIWRTRPPKILDSFENGDEF